MLCFNRFPPKGILFQVYSIFIRRWRRALEAVPWSLAKPNHQPAAAAGSYSVQSPLAAKCVMRLENTFCCFPSPQCMLPALFYTVLCSVLAMFFWLLVFLLSSNLFFPYNNIPWFFCSSAAASLRNFVGKPCNFGSELSPLEPSSSLTAKEPALGVYISSSLMFCAAAADLFSIFPFLICCVTTVAAAKNPYSLIFGVIFWENLTNALIWKKKSFDF